MKNTKIKNNQKNLNPLPKYKSPQREEIYPARICKVSVKELSKCLWLEMSLQRG